MELTGTIIKVEEVLSGTSKTGAQWSRQNFVLEYPSGQYMRHALMEIFGQERIQKFAIREGLRATVKFDVDAREYQGRWFNTLGAWSITQAAEGAEQPQQAPVAPATAFAPLPADYRPQQPQTSEDGQTDLPF